MRDPNDEEGPRSDGYYDPADWEPIWDPARPDRMRRLFGDDWENLDGSELLRRAGMRELEAAARLPRRPRPRRRSLPAHPGLPGREIAAGTGQPRDPHRQVNVKLGPTDYERLVEAASLYRLAPTTLARALVNRGVGVIVESGPSGDRNPRG